MGGEAGERGDAMAWEAGVESSSRPEIASSSGRITKLTGPRGSTAALSPLAEMELLKQYVFETPH